MSCAQRAQRLKHIERGLDMLRQKLTLATRVCKSSATSRKNSRPKEDQMSLLERMRTPKEKGRRKQNIPRIECCEKSHPVIPEETHQVPSLMVQMTSPLSLPLLKRLTEYSSLPTVKSESNLTSSTSSKLHTSLKRKEHPRTSEEPTGCSTTGQRISRRLSGDMTFAPADLSSRLQSLRISSQDDASTLMRSSRTTTPPSQPTNRQRNLESLNSRSHPITLLERLNPLLTGSQLGEDLSEPTGSCSHSELTSSDGMANSFHKCSPNINPSVTSMLFNSTKQSENALEVVAHSSSLTSLISQISSPLISSLPALSTTSKPLPNLEDETELEARCRDQYVSRSVSRLFPPTPEPFLSCSPYSKFPIICYRYRTTPAYFGLYRSQLVITLPI